MHLWLHRFACLTCVATFLLLCAGALVTSTGSGLAVPDWPLSYGQFFPPMVGGVLYEHSHRMIAGTVAILTCLLTLATWRIENRKWVKILSSLALLAVICQALLGGLTVLFRLPLAVSVAHACLAQIFFCLTVILSVLTSPSWRLAQDPLPVDRASIQLKRLCLNLTTGFFLQLLLGATMRHLGAGLAIPDFPLAFGRVFPPLISVGVAVHFAHRMGAFCLTLVSIWTVTLVYRYYSDRLGLLGIGGILIFFLSNQLMLGALTIWLRRPPLLTMAHLGVGALCLASSLVLTTVVFRLRREVSFAREVPERARLRHMRDCGT